ncbi:MAG: glycosyltransferase [Gemmatimonadales bacterium]|nr:glycosyltransferase [Gemmatimonadales bacterium]
MKENEKPTIKLLVGPYLSADWSDYMAGAFADYDAKTFGPWEGADLKIDGLPSLEQILDLLPADWSPDLLLLWRPEYVYIPPGLETAPFPTAALVSDWYLAFSDSLEAAWRVDALVTGTRGERIFRAAGFENVVAMPMLGYQPDLDGRYALPTADRNIDVFCGGNPNWIVHKERALVHAELKKLSDQIRIHEGPLVDRVEFNRLMGRSRIFVNQTVIGEVNMKVYEATASGTCLFVEEDNLDIRNYLVPDESVVLFNRANLNEKILYFLEHEEERAAIAERAKPLMAPFTYRRNMSAIVERLIGQDGLCVNPGPRPISELGPEEIAEGLAGYALRHNGEDPMAAVALCSALKDGPRSLLLNTCAKYTVNYTAGHSSQWENSAILKSFAMAKAADPESLQAAYTWAKMATAYVAPMAQGALDDLERLLLGNCAVPFSSAGPYFGMDRNMRFVFQRTAWEALEAGQSMDEALRALLLEDLNTMRKKTGES